MHKPAQVELQLDQSQLPYSETFRPITAGGNPAQRNTQKRPLQYINSTSKETYLF